MHASDTHLQTLHRLLYASADARCLLWVNPAQGDPFADDPLVQERMVRVPLSHPRFDVRFAPYLVPLALARYADAEVFARSVQLAWDAWQLDSLKLANGQAIAGWVVLQDAPEALASHWARNCHVHMDKGLSKLLRFHDPGVREWLWPSLSAIQQSQLLGPAERLVSINREQQLMFHERPSAVPAEAGRLLLDREQWAQIDDYAILHAAWLQLDRQVLPLPRIFDALRQATRYGIQDPPDRMLFALHAMQIGHDFHADSRLAPVWASTAAGEFYGGAVEAVTGHPATRLDQYLLQT